jgi:hypothetical protein
MYHKQKDLVSKNMDFESDQDCEIVRVELPSFMHGIDFTKTYDTHEESFRQIEHSNQVIKEYSYESDLELEMAREGFNILRSLFGLDYAKTHEEHIDNLHTMEDEVKNPAHKVPHKSYHHLRKTYHA